MGLARHVSVLTCVLALAALIAGSATAQDGPANPDEVIATQDELQSPSALGTTQVWLARAPGGLKLVQRINGVVSDAPVPPFDDADADLDLGTDARGQTVLVYARCPGSRRTQNCDVYTWKPGTTATERRVRGASGRDCHETNPSVDAGRIAFVRRPRSRRCRPGIWIASARGRASRRDARTPTALDLAGPDLAATFSRLRIERERGCRSCRTDIDSTALALLPAVGRSGGRVLARAEHRSDEVGGEDGGFLDDPKLDGGYVYFQRRAVHSGEGGGSECVDLARISRRRRGASPEVLPTRVDAFDHQFDWAVSGDSIFYTDGSSLRRVSDSPLEFDGRYCEPE